MAQREIKLSLVYQQLIAVGNAAILSAILGRKVDSLALEYRVDLLNGGGDLRQLLVGE